MRSECRYSSRYGPCFRKNSQKIDVVKNIYRDSIAIKSVKKKSFAVVNSDSGRYRNESIVTYKFENDSVIQLLKVRFVSKNRIQFALVDSAKKQNIAFKLIGHAKASASADPEIDEDEEGTAYPAISFVGENTCPIYIRLELGLKNKAQFYSERCFTNNKNRSLKSISVLNRLKK